MRSYASRPFLSLSIVLALLLGGCSAFRLPEEPPQPTPMDPVISEDELEDHIEFLNGDDLMGRATGTQGFARAAAYIAARMNEFRLQPAVEDEYRIVYGASINYPVSSSLRLVGERDSLTFLPGVDYLPDARSDAGDVRVSRLVIAGGEPVSARAPFGVVVETADDALLRAWRDAGARLVVIASDLRPRIHREPIADLLVVSMTPRAVGLLFGVPGARLSNYLESRRGQTIALSRQMVGRVTTDYQPQAGAINVMGYYSGKHPVRRRELVIVCADLDAVGHLAGVRTLDFRNFGISTAAVLEATRNLGFVTRLWSVPERSVMVAIWSGSQLGHEGLRYFLENPTWRLERIVSMVYVGLETREEEEVRQLLRPYGIPLTVIPPEAPLYSSDLLLQPDPAVLRLAEERDGNVGEPEDLDDSAIIDSAVVRAASKARKAFYETMLEATDPASFFPVREDTLPAPSAGVD